MSDRNEEHHTGSFLLIASQSPLMVKSPQ